MYYKYIRLTGHPFLRAHAIRNCLIPRRDRFIMSAASSLVGPIYRVLAAEDYRPRNPYTAKKSHRMNQWGVKKYSSVKRYRVLPALKITIELAYRALLVINP